jgi:hypothetical protein
MESEYTTGNRILSKTMLDDMRPSHTKVHESFLGPRIREKIYRAEVNAIVSRITLESAGHSDSEISALGELTKLSPRLFAALEYQKL